MAIIVIHQGKLDCQVREKRFFFYFSSIQPSKQECIYFFLFFSEFDLVLSFLNLESTYSIILVNPQPTPLTLPLSSAIVFAFLSPEFK